LWAGGAALLVASAIKFVLIDFGALGQLANILAVIAAGGMFLLVGWLAPIPPASRDDETPPATDFKGSATPSRTPSPTAPRLGEVSRGPSHWS
jgi:hypothetical protein